MTELVTLAPPLSPIVAIPATFTTLRSALQIDAAVEAHAVELRLADGSSVPPELKTWAAAYWSSRALTFIFSGGYRGQVFPGAFVPDPDRTRTPRLWDLSEVVEVFIGENARLTGRYREFEVAPDSRWTALDVQVTQLGVMGDEHVASDALCLSATNATNDLWTAVIEIPWSDLQAEGPPGGTWHCNLYRSIPGQGEPTLMAWRPTGFGPKCFHAPARFGELILPP
jgi:hypothetical protein